MKPLILAAGAALSLAAGAAHAQSLVGTWSATVNWNLPSGVMITSSFTSDGRLDSTTQNHQGQAFMLRGAYQYDPERGVLSFRWNDYAPHQICTTFCTPAPPPAPMGLTYTQQIRFLNANQFVASSQDGSTIYLRSNAAGFPAP